MNGRPETERGTATLWAVGGIAVLCLVAAALLTFGSVVQTRHRVTAAADLAALAGAAYVPYGLPAAFDRVQWVAAHMGARATTCRLLNLTVLVEVSCSLPGVLSRFGPVSARAAAGPVDGGPDG